MALNPDCGGHTVVVPGVIHLNLMAFASEEVTVLIVRKIPFYANTNACHGCTLCCSVINFRSLLTDFKCKSICCIQPFQLLFEVRQIFVHKMAIYIPLASDTKSNQTVCQCDNHTVKADLTTYWHNYDILTNIKPKQKPVSQNEGSQCGFMEMWQHIVFDCNQYWSYDQEFGT